MKTLAVTNYRATSVRVAAGLAMGIGIGACGTVALVWSATSAWCQSAAIHGAMEDLLDEATGAHKGGKRASHGAAKRSPAPAPAPAPAAAKATAKTQNIAPASTKHAGSACPKQYETKWPPLRGVSYEICPKNASYGELTKNYCAVIDPPQSLAECENSKQRAPAATGFSRAVVNAATLPRFDDVDFPHECTWAALTDPWTTSKDAQDNYRYCKNGKSPSVAMWPRPCVDERYHRFVHESFVGTVECVLGADPSSPCATASGEERRLCLDRERKQLQQELFSLWSRESHFHVNAYSQSKALGVAQLTTDAVKHINRETTNLKHFKDSPACAPIKFALKAHADPKASHYACSMLSAPENPALGFLYGALYYRSIQKAAEKILSSWTTNRYAQNPELRHKYAVMLTRWAYNGGIGTIKDHFDVFIQLPWYAELSPQAFASKFKEFLDRYYKIEHFDELNTKQAVLLQKKRRTAAENKELAKVYKELARLQARHDEVAGYAENVRTSVAKVQCLATGERLGTCNAPDRALKYMNKEPVCHYDPLQ